MNFQRLFFAGIAWTLAAMIGCGGADVVSVDRTQSDAANRRSSSERQSRPSTDASSNTSSTGAGSPAPNPNSQPNPSVATTESVPSQPSTNPSPTDSEPPTSTETPGVSPVTPPPPPPSNYRVLLPSGGSLDIKRLLEKQRDDFEVKLASIARGKQMLRTFYITNSQPAASESIPSTDSTPGVESAEPVPQSYKPGKRRRRRPRSLRGQTEARQPNQDNGSSTPQIDTSKPFMYIGRIAATLRGPTAAYYPDGTPMIYISYDRDSRRDGTLISWDEKQRPVVIDQFIKGRRNGLRVLFRTRSDNDPTGYVALVQEWRGGKLSATHLVADHGGAQTIEPAASLLDETNEALNDRLTELDEFDSTLRKNEQQLRKALTAMHREEIRMAKAIKSAIRQQQQAQAMQAQIQILQQLTSGIQSPGAWRNGYRNR